jgi:hypothetical protein
MKNNFRHGDIAFIKANIDTSLLKKIGEKAFTIAEGEKTGHCHVITAKTGIVEVFEGKNGEMIINVNGIAVLTHPEHKTLEFPTGTWRVDREQEWDYFAKAKRQVID